MRVLAAACVWLLSSSLIQAASKPLQIFFIDVEGGQATLFVTPGGESLLIDTGWPGNAYRDANRIAAAAKLAKIKRLDYVLITHYHDDHVGGVPQLVSKLHVGAFIDHGALREPGKREDNLLSEYQKAIGDSQRITAKPGDHLPIKGLEAVIVSADGNVIDQPLPGAGSENGSCSGVEKRDVDPSENARSVGTVMTFGKLKIVDLGDLTWNKELELMCPTNKIGKADIYVASHHGLDQSNSPALVHGIAPRVVIMDNGATKGGKPAAWDIIHSSPGLEAFWQLHFSNEGGSETQRPRRIHRECRGSRLRVLPQIDGK